MTRCQHCYHDIREAAIEVRQFDHLLPIERRSAWLDTETRSPFCLYGPCPGNGEPHEIRHTPMPVV